MFHYDCFLILSEGNRFESGFAALAAGSPSHFGEGRQERGPERIPRWRNERTLSKLLPSDLFNLQSNALS
jgi:hypothetical protein